MPPTAGLVVVCRYRLERSVLQSIVAVVSSRVPVSATAGTADDREPVRPKTVSIVEQPKQVGDGKAIRE